ncbi:MAG: MBL fold metallo-hydrolase [Promethearchaeota archaeon]|nr:MAG: MBL fold metallo-hydrolase [Candidatus Lokiarchaeota archaeon]
MKEIIKDVYHVGSSGCDIYLVDTKSKDGLVLIDCGMDISLIKSITKKGLDLTNILHCIITHCHIDHIGACNELSEFNNKVKFYAHELDAPPIEEEGHTEKTAASWYGVTYKPIKLYRKFTKQIEILQAGPYEFKCIHTPGHTPGSISVLLEIHGKKILFGQDIHGPFYESFGSNLNDYQESMERLLQFKPDILCEGHFGIIQPAEEVEKYIRNYMDQNLP